MRLEILPVLCQYILSVMLFILYNPNNFQTVSAVHGLHTRSNNQLFIPNTNLTTAQKAITYCCITIYNSLPSNILSLKNDRKLFKNESHRYLLGNSFYCVK